MIPILVGLILALSSPTSAANHVYTPIDRSSTPVILHDKGHTLTITPPEGSLLITREMAKQDPCGEMMLSPASRNEGIIASILQHSGGRPRGVSYIGVDSLARGTSGDASLSAAEEKTLAAYGKATPGIEVLRWEKAVTGDARAVPVVVCHFGDTFEVVAFIGEPKVVVRIGTRVRELDGGCDRALEILRSIVATYTPVVPASK